MSIFVFPSKHSPVEGWQLGHSVGHLFLQNKPHVPETHAERDTIGEGLISNLLCFTLVARWFLVTPTAKTI
jgi:hypothetical protein